jgi:glycosyltransferase involved in cell wall biosynthesis
MITVILNGYKRSKNLDEQYQALLNQTVKPDEILLWYNNPQDDSVQINYDLGTKIPAAYCNYNFGVWARFAFALNSRNPYVCVFDDDTIPGRRWLENCMETMKTHEGLLGTVGLLYTNPGPASNSSYYEHYVRYGWPNPDNSRGVTQVDLVGHSWFFKKEWLSHMFRELPDPKYDTCGEDMHFSYMLQKYAGINTYVPPHPPEDRELWGSLKAMEYGDDSNSLWHSNKRNIGGVPFRQLMDQYFREQRIKGWRLVNEK